ncbi:MAG: hypothetical protein O3A82_05215 [Verrucomicrobia bacterium]|nr:hypothetical protein [Verrucomicrobiota bacterium]MDA1046311.1 hypothetical protein [Verrucomicrobiota bacterium]
MAFRLAHIEPLDQWHGGPRDYLGCGRVEPIARRRKTVGQCANRDIDRIAGLGGGVPDDEPDLDWFNRSRNPSNPDPDGYDQRPTWKHKEIHLEDGRILVFD